MNNTRNTISPRRLGIAFGATGVVFYLGCIITMGTVSHAKAIVFFNSLLHGLDEIGLTLQHADDIRTFETQRRADQPWLFG